MAHDDRKLQGRLDSEALRVPVEREVWVRLRRDANVQRLLDAHPPVEAKKARRELLAHALLLSEAMAPEVHRQARLVTGLLGIDRPVEIFQSAGFDDVGIDAAIYHTGAGPILLNVKGRALTNLDEAGVLAVIGHELGHHLAHGSKCPLKDLARMAGVLTYMAPTEAYLRLGSALSMAMELTADRFGLLTCQDLDAFLQVEMVHASGLPSSSLSWDTKEYLAQCRALMEETLEAGESILGISHPEHNMRAYAAWLFSETSLYAGLTGAGEGERTLADVNDTVARLLQPQNEGGQPANGDSPSPQVRRRVITAPSDTWDGVGESVGGALENVKGAVGRASKAVSPGLDRIKAAASVGVARVLDRKAPPSASSGRGAPDDEPFDDPLEDDDKELLDRFAALEREQGPVKRPPAADDDGDADLLDRFAELERQNADPSELSDDELMKRLEALEKSEKAPK